MDMVFALGSLLNMNYSYIEYRIRPFNAVVEVYYRF